MMQDLNLACIDPVVACILIHVNLACSFTDFGLKNILSTQKWKCRERKAFNHVMGSSIMSLCKIFFNRYDCLRYIRSKEENLGVQEPYIRDILTDKPLFL